MIKALLFQISILKYDKKIFLIHMYFPTPLHKQEVTQG